MRGGGSCGRGHLRLDELLLLELVHPMGRGGLQSRQFGPGEGSVGVHQELGFAEAWLALQIVDQVLQPD